MSSQLPFDPASPAKFAAWLKANRACTEAVAWVGDRSAIEALEALAALEPTEQHIEWSCWVADRILPDDAQRRLRAALLRTLPQHLCAIPVVEGVIKALEADPFAPERLDEARVAAAAARAEAEATSNASRARAWTAWTRSVTEVAAASVSSAWAAWVTWTAWPGETPGVGVKDVLPRQLAVLKDALTDFLKAGKSQ
jgi:hypothetical protein